MNSNQRGIAPIVILLLVVLASAGLSGLGYGVYKYKKASDESVMISSTSERNQQQTTQYQDEAQRGTTEVPKSESVSKLGDKLSPTPLEKVEIIPPNNETTVPAVQYPSTHGTTTTLVDNDFLISQIEQCDKEIEVEFVGGYDFVSCYWRSAIQNIPEGTMKDVLREKLSKPHDCNLVMDLVDSVMDNEEKFGLRDVCLASVDGAGVHNSACTKFLCEDEFIAGMAN